MNDTNVELTMAMSACLIVEEGLYSTSTIKGLKTQIGTNSSKELSISGVVEIESAVSDDRLQIKGIELRFTVDTNPRGKVLQWLLGGSLSNNDGESSPILGGSSKDKWSVTSSIPSDNKVRFIRDGNVVVEFPKITVK